MKLREFLTSPAECRKVARLLQSYLDQEIDDAIAAQVAHHLEGCRRCGLAFDTYRTIKSALARRRLDVDREAVDRLTEFSERLAAAE